MNRLLTAILTCVAAVSAFAGIEWTNLDDDHHIAGPKITSASLRGKVVLVDYWGKNCGPCRAALPRIQQIWESWSDRRFAVVGAHCQASDDDAVRAILKEAGATYPVYQNLEASGTPSFNAIPFLCVFDPRGRLVYSGHSVPEATEAVVNEITEISGVRQLLPTATLAKYKPLKAQLALGKNVESHMKKLKADIAAAEKAPRNKLAQDKAAEARAILKDIKTTYDRIVSDIEWEIEDDPAAAMRDYVLLGSTWPSAKPKAEERWGEKIKEISADPAVKKHARELLDEMKKVR